MFQLEESFAPFGVDVVADRRTAELDGLMQHVTQSFVKFPQFDRGERR
jgi:hypothetical protein